MSPRRLLLTFDRDFGELIYRHGEPAPAGVMYLRFRPADAEEPARVLSAILERPEIVLEARFIVAAVCVFFCRTAGSAQLS
jgi:predicted nuclease of predicted toxin-antitoxin system